MLHPTVWHVESWREHAHNEHLHNQIGAYASTQIVAHLPPTVNLAHVPPSLLRPRALSHGAQNELVLGAGGTDRMSAVRRSIASAAMPLAAHTHGAATARQPAAAATFLPPTQQHLDEIRLYGHHPSHPYNSADFPPRVGMADLRKGKRFEGLDSHPLVWDPSIDTSSSKQFRTREEQGVKFKSFLHPPVTPPRKQQRSAPSGEFAASAAASSSLSGSQTARSSSGVSTKRYHRPVKPALPELNHATYLAYLANTQPLLSACIAGRRRCQMSVWRDELLKRKIDPHSQNPHA